MGQDPSQMYTFGIGTHRKLRILSSLSACLVRVPNSSGEPHTEKRHVFFPLSPQIVKTCHKLRWWLSHQSLKSSIHIKKGSKLFVFKGLSLSLARLDLVFTRSKSTKAKICLDVFFVDIRMHL